MCMCVFPKLSQAQQRKDLPLSLDLALALSRSLLLSLSLGLSALSKPRNPAGSPDEMGQDGWMGLFQAVVLIS